MLLIVTHITRFLLLSSFFLFDIKSTLRFHKVSNFNVLKTLTLIEHAVLVLCFRNSQNSDIDYRIFNLRMKSFCMRISRTRDLSLYSQPKDVVESAETNKQNKTNKQTNKNSSNNNKRTKTTPTSFNPFPLLPVPNTPYGFRGR